MSRMIITLGIVCYFLLGVPFVELAKAEPVRGDAVLAVNTLVDAPPNIDGFCSLREAILNANANDQSGSTDCLAGAGSEDVIAIQVPGQIVLSAGLPVISDGVSIIGDPDGTAISGADAYQIFIYNPGVAAIWLVLEGLTIEHGYAPLNGGGALQKLTGDALIRSSTLRLNQALSGGAAYNGSGEMKLVNCTLYGNTALPGGASNGGALINASGWTMKIISSTFVSNEAQTGGSQVFNASGVVYVYNSILAFGLTTANCGGTITNLGNNIDTGTSCAFGAGYDSHSSTDPLLGLPGIHGGPTATIPLLPGSPAIDGVTFSPPNQSPDVDQRGWRRPVDGDGDGIARHDIGAFEYYPKWIYLPVVVKP